MDRQTGRQADRQAARQAGKQPARQDKTRQDMTGRDETGRDKQDKTGQAGQDRQAGQTGRTDRTYRTDKQLDKQTNMQTCKVLYCPKNLASGVRDSAALFGAQGPKFRDSAELLKSRALRCCAVPKIWPLEGQKPRDSTALLRSLRSKVLCCPKNLASKEQSLGTLQHFGALRLQKCCIVPKN